MKQKQLIILLAVFAIVGGIGISAYKGQKKNWSSSGEGTDVKVVADFPLNDVAEIVIRENDGSVTLKKEADGWKVADRGNYPANFDEISSLLTTVWELEPVQKPKVGESNLGRLKLLDPTKSKDADKAATVVEFKGAGGTAINTLALGKEHMRKSQNPGGMGGGSFADGRYVMADSDLASVSLVSETFSNVKADAKGWLKKDFLKIQKIKSVAYMPENKTDGWKLARESETGEFALADKKADEELDATKTSGLKHLLSNPTFVDVAADTKAEKTGMDKPAKAEIETFDGFKYTLKIGKKDETQNLHVAFGVSADIPSEREIPDDEKLEDKAKFDAEFAAKIDVLNKKLKDEKAYAGTIYLLSSWSVDALTKKRSELLKEKAPEPQAGPMPAPAPPVSEAAAPKPVVPTPKAAAQAPVPEKQSTKLTAPIAVPEVKEIPPAPPGSEIGKPSKSKAAPKKAAPTKPESEDK